MWRNYNGEWERKKQYLIRSLFDDAPPLSPIPEIQTPPVESPSPTEIALSRPYSPLPDLIVEKEPNRHDDSKEYYEAMEKKVMKWYRKMFYDEQSSDSSTTNDIFGDQDSYASDTVRKPTKLPSNESRTPSREEDEAVEDESGKDEDESDENETVIDISLSNDLNTDKSTTSPEPHDNYVTQAQVHRAGSEVIDIGTHYSSIPSVMRAKSLEEQVLNKTANDASTLDTGCGHRCEPGRFIEECEDTVIEYASTSNEEEKVLKSQSSSQASGASTSPDEPETMRRRKTTSYDAVVSTHDLNIARYCSEDSPEASAEISFSREMEEQKLSSSNSSASSGTASKILSPRKRKIDDACNWEDIKNNFFIGRPRIFKLCSCQNHVCQ